MISTVLNYVYVVLLVHALIVFVEVLVNFKSPKILKFLLLSFILAVAGQAFGNLYNNFYGYARWTELPTPILLVAFMSFFSILYHYHIKNYVIGLALFIILSQWVSLFYYEFVKPLPPHIRLNEAVALGSIRDYLKTAYTVVVFLIIADFYLKIKKKYRAENIYFKQTSLWAIWLLISALVVATSSLFRGYYGFDFVPTKITNLTATFSAVLAILFRPKFLNKSSLKLNLGSTFIRKNNFKVPSNAFFELFYNQCYYLNPEASMEHMAKLLEQNTQDVFQFVYANYALGFNDLVNKHRVNYFIDLVKSNQYPHYTIDALAQLSGFGSRHHLYKPFQKFHGGTPSDFISSIPSK